MNFKGI